MRPTYQGTFGSTMVLTPPLAAGDSRPRLGGAVAGSMIGKSAEMVTLLLLATLVPRILGPADFGRFSVPLTLVTLGSLALTLGGPTVMARFVPAAAPEDRLATARALGARLARSRAALVAAVAAGALAASVARPDLFPRVETVLVVLALALNVAATLALQVGLGLERTGWWSARYPVQNTVLIVAVLVLHSVAGVTGAVVAILVAAVVAAGFAARAFTVLSLGGVRQTAVSLPEGAIRFGVFHATGAALGQLTHRGAVVVVALMAGSASEAGFAALATGAAVAVTYAVLQAFTVSLPHLAGRRPTQVTPGSGDPPIDSPGRPHEAEAVLRRLAGLLLVAILPAVTAVTVSLDRLLVSALGTEFQGATAAFGPALALVVLAPVHALAVQAAALRVRPEASLANGIVSASVFLLVSVVAVPGWGAAGGTAAALAGVAAGNLTWLRLCPRAVGGRLVVASFAGAAAVLVLALVA